MERENKKASCGTSWADVVEREEEEEAHRQRIEIEAKTSRGKSNPFGAARPREVVLEEKGVDWRKLDQDLQLNIHSNLRKDKKLKENILPTPLQTVGHGRFPPGSTALKQPQPRHTSPLVPTLMYPPKNIMAVMEQIRKGRKDLKDDTSMVDSCNMMNGESFGDGSSASDRRSERRRSYAYGDQRARTARYNDGGSSYGGGLRSAGNGVRERIDVGNVSDGGVELRDAIRMKKRRLSAVVVHQPGPCNHIGRQGKQHRT